MWQLNVRNSALNYSRATYEFIDRKATTVVTKYFFLLSKLGTYGIMANAHSLKTSYLSGRENSELLDILYEVPQESCHGPSLFKPISNIYETNLEDRIIKTGEATIQQVSGTKFLSIIIDDKLT